MKLLLADSHSLFREGMKYILKEMHPGIELLVASNPHDVIQYVTQEKDINLIILDIEISITNDIDIINQLLTISPTSIIVILSASKKPEDIRLALLSGAKGYITKCSQPIIMKNALQLILSGGIYLPPIMFIETEKVNDSKTKIKLTPRQSDILKLIVDGLSNKHIAKTLNLTESTVKVHASAIFKTLNVKNRTQAAIKAQSLVSNYI